MTLMSKVVATALVEGRHMLFWCGLQSFWVTGHSFGQLMTDATTGQGRFQINLAVAHDATTGQGPGLVNVF